MYKKKISDIDPPTENKGEERNKIKSGRKIQCKYKKKCRNQVIKVLLNEGKTEREIYWWVGAASAVMKVLCTGLSW